MPALTSCAGPQSALDPAGPAAEIIAWLWWGMLSFFTLVFVAVVGLWLYAMRRHPSSAITHAQAVRSTNRWVLAGGLALPLFSISVLLATGIPAGQRILTLPADTVAPLRVDVHARRWWWDFHYPDTGITIANELTVPAGTPIDLRVHSDNVIHSFWVPSLGGKIDVVPGRVNRLRLQANQSGTLRGQCAEFCGTGHAHMVFEVQVLERDDFARWQQQRRENVVVVAEHRRGADSFVQHCGDCHAVRGLSNGSSAPDLSNIGARRLMGAGQRDGRKVSVGQWLEAHPQGLQSDDTPHHSRIGPDHLAEIAAWLETLH